MNANRTRDAPRKFFEIIFETLTRFCEKFSTVYMKAKKTPSAL